MTEQRFRVGIVGLEPGRGWAARAHVLALRASPMARDLREGTRTAPSSEDAVTARRVIAVERAAEHVPELADQAKLEVRLVADDFGSKSVSGIDIS